MEEKMITIRIKKDLLKRFKIQLARNSDTITGVVTRAIAEYVEESEKINQVRDHFEGIIKKRDENE